MSRAKKIAIAILAIKITIIVTALSSPRAFRWIVGRLTMLPYVATYRIVSLLLGKRRAVTIFGRLLTRIAAFVGRLSIPVVKSSREYPVFKKKLAKNFMLLKNFYGVEIIGESDRSIEFRIKYCPFTAALKDFGAPELCKFACASDFVIADANRDKWKFSRTHSHGTDGQCCNHTYSALETAGQED